MRSKKEKIVLLAVLIISVVVALGAGSGIYVLQKKADELQTANTGLQSRVAHAQTKLKKLPELRAERESAQSQLQVAESILPSQEEIENLVDNLADFAQKSGAVIAKTKPVRQGAYRAAAGVKKFEEATFDLDLQADFFQFVEFVNLLENYHRFIRIDGFNASPGRSADEPLKVAVKFATFTYTGAPATTGPRVAVKGGM